MQNFTHEIRKFQKLNELAKSGSIVFLGGAFFSRIPAGELAQNIGLDAPVVSRCLPGATLEQAQQLAPAMLEALHPDSVFLNFGEADLEQDGFDLDVFCETYEWLLYTIHRTTRAKLHIVSILSGAHAAAAANRRLSALAKNTGCIFVDISAAAVSAEPELRAFQCLRPILRRGRIGFADAMSSATA